MQLPDIGFFMWAYCKKTQIIVKSDLLMANTPPGLGRNLEGRRARVYLRVSCQLDIPEKRKSSVKERRPAPTSPCCSFIHP